MGAAQGPVLRVGRLHERADLDLPGHRARGRRGRGGRERADRDRDRSAGRPGRADRARGGLEDADRPDASEIALAVQGMTRRPRESGGMSTVAPTTEARPFEHLVLDFLGYLEFERGLSRNTLEAYRTDLLQFGRWLDEQGLSAATDHRGRGLGVGRGAGGGEREAARVARDDPPQDGVPALVLPPSAPRGRARLGPDRRDQLAAPRAEAAARALPRRGPEAAVRAARDRAGVAARPRAARAHVRVRPARVGGDRAGADGRGRRRAGAARARQGLEGATRPDRARRGRGAADLPRARPARARAQPARAPPVRELPRRAADAPGALQDRPPPRGRRRAWPTA